LIGKSNLRSKSQRSTGAPVPKVKLSRQAEGSESLQAQWGFEELGTLPDESLGAGGRGVDENLG
jgi:hypothetical protein